MKKFEFWFTVFTIVVGYSLFVLNIVLKNYVESAFCFFFASAIYSSILLGNWQERLIEDLKKDFKEFSEESNHEN